ncbi:MAG: glucuronate isomerase [Chitinispirillaceae bacterium]|nr:glucuronate isomerase [Chitinispirillaceae bacterium]
MARYELHPDRFFDPDPVVRKHAREIYECTRSLPIVSPHGHVDPKIFAGNNPFPNPAELFITPDHYLFRMLYSQGISLEALGIPRIDGGETGSDPKKIWRIFAENYYLFNGTPTGVWLDYEFNVVFGIKEKPDGGNASKIYDELQEKISSSEFLPRTLFKRFDIEALSTTDTAIDTLPHHQSIRESGWDGRIIPCFRPDTVTDIATKNWTGNIARLGELTGKPVDSYAGYIAALEKRRAFFRRMGATSTDHGVFAPFTHELTEKEVDSLFRKALRGNAAPEDARFFNAHMLMEMARMSTNDGMVMQIHPGCCRSHNMPLFEKSGPDKGHDIPVLTEYTLNMRELLNRYGNDPRLTLIVFTLDESTYSRELAPLAGHYPAMKLGPAWWFNDSIQGITRYRQSVTETAGFYNTVGFNDDTRAFVSIPARHDVARRVDANYLGGLVARHIITRDEALVIAKDLTYNLVKRAYKL